MKNIVNKFKAILMHPATFILAATTVFFTFDKLSARSDSPSIDINRAERSSVTFVDGDYKVDSIVIRNDFNKKRLIAEIEKQEFIQKNTIQEVPSFLWEFLDSISYDRKFDIVNPGEEYKTGITNYGHVIIKKVYDPNLMDSVFYLAGDGAILPNKQLVYFGLGKNIALMSYVHGGTGPFPNILIFKFQNKRVTDFWYGGSWEGDNMTNKKNILKYLKSKRENKGC